MGDWLAAQANVDASKGANRVAPSSIGHFRFSPKSRVTRGSRLGSAHSNAGWAACATRIAPPRSEHPAFRRSLVSHAA
ncbi:hypothetical protein WS86_04575 [Burkholderia savannae]|nr:hypothetical protein WS86_04575 [Burkholderia savannae]